jgi:ATP/maltotriose-dependent transcriptional regulator MalT
VPLAEECIALQQRTGAESDRALMLRCLAELRLESGDLDGAERALDEARRFVEKNPEESYGAWLAWLRGRLARVRGDHARAAAHWDAALAEAERLGLGLLAAYCRLTRGLLHRERGETEDARRDLAAAAAAFRAIGVTPRAAEADTALASL